MRVIHFILGAVLVVFGISGLLLITLAPRPLVQTQVNRVAMQAAQVKVLAPVVRPLTVLSAAVQDPGATAGAGPALQVAAEAAPVAPVAPVAPDASVETGAATAAPEEATGVPVARLVISGIGLNAPVVEAPLVRGPSGVTWEVPAYRVGHGQYTAGAGGEGNAVFLGHVTSLNEGNVFANLDRVHPGDDITLVATDGHTYHYLVDDVRVVPRDDTTVLDSTGQPTATLITCTGAWLPAIHEYAQRLVVQATLVHQGGG